MCKDINKDNFHPQAVNKDPHEGYYSKHLEDSEEQSTSLGFSCVI